MADLIASVSTLQSSLARRRQHALLSQGISRAEKEVSTGLKADIFRDLGHRSSEAVRLHNLIERNEGFISSNKLLAGRMEITDLAMTDIRGVADDFLALAVSAANPGSAISSELQANAQFAINRIVAQANTVYQGSYIFAGIDEDTSPLQQWSNVNAATGLSPSDVIASIVGSGPATLADVSTITADLQSVFDGTNANANYNYEATFYNGTPQAAGQRVEARIGEGVTLSHGIQANDAGFTELMRGLSMLVATDISQIQDDDTYAAYLDAAVQAISKGSTMLLDAQSRLGTMQGLVDETIEQQEQVNDVYSYRILDLEGVDSYEAATRLSQLQAQLEASFSVTARLSQLSLINFL